ncbi:hypothetical protein IFT68_00715 [Oxalobacteraceae sp. CFBP 13730]|nr:hypothetical protein [Oxalobacteraceae sp. CFBP 13730]
MITFIPKRGSVELRNAILDCIDAGLHRTAEIAQHLNLKSDQVSTRLDYLRQLGVIHATRIDDDKRGGFVNNWQMGPRPESQASYGAKDLPRRRATDERRIILSSAYPAIDRRDPLVTALFGAPVAEPRAPQQSAPVCTVCRMEQGTGHQADCIVAMVAA